MSIILTVNLFSGHSLPRETTENVSEQVYFLFHRESLVADAHKLEERLRTGEISKGSYRARKAHITRRISHELWVAMHGSAVTAEGDRFRYMPYRDEQALACCPDDMGKQMSSKKLWGGHPRWCLGAGPSGPEAGHAPLHRTRHPRSWPGCGHDGDCHPGTVGSHPGRAWGHGSELSLGLHSWGGIRLSRSIGL